MDSYDAVVVGGGPVGCRTASLIADAGFSVCILEEHDIIGEPIQCAGIVSPRVLEIAPYRSCLQNEIFGAEIYSPSGRVMKIEADSPKALIINRSIFDKELAKEAKRAGAEIRCGTKAIGFRRENGRVFVNSVTADAGIEVSAKLIIGSDGVQGGVAKHFSLPRPPKFLIGMVAEAADIEMEREIVKLYTGSAIAPGFFAWVIPTENHRARIGLCVSKKKKKPVNVRACFYSLCRKGGLKSIKLNPDKIEKPMPGAIPVGPVKRTVADNVMLVGDAAGHVKPTSGGGIYIGLRCAEHCASAAIKSLKEHSSRSLSSENLSLYENLWRTDIGGELNRGWVIHRAYSSLNDGQIEQLFDIFNKPNVKKIIEEKGDIDFASNLSRPLLKEAPALMKFAGPFLKSLL